MRSFSCTCGNKVYFENSYCHNCNSALGFTVDNIELSPIQASANGLWQSTTSSQYYRKCQNYEQQHDCNWMIAEHDHHSFCLSCRLSEIIPNLSSSQNIDRWYRIEKAKRRLLYSLIQLDLPVIDREQDPDTGLAFHLMEDVDHFSEFSPGHDKQGRITTGHIKGVITLNIEEADPVLREQIRTKLQEGYRTLLGHLRHESGHFYWEQFIANSSALADFRMLFGDETQDYESALQTYYQNGPGVEWQPTWISAYASAHPWEDWAECWAHYLHMIDTLETAANTGFSDTIGQGILQGIDNFNKSSLSDISIQQLCDEWSHLSVALNEMNRSMGLPDAYPFVLSPNIIQKLEFIHRTIIGHNG